MWKENKDDSQKEIARLNHQVNQLYERGQYKDAINIGTQLCNIVKQTFGENHPNYAGCLNTLANLYGYMGDYSKAEPLYQQSVDILRKDQASYVNRDLLLVLDNLARVYVATSHQDDAREMMKEAALVDDKVLSQVFSIASERQQMSFIRRIRGNFYRFLSLILDYFPNSLQDVCDAYSLVLRRKTLGAEALATRREAVLSGKYPELEAKLRELETLRLQICRKTLDGPSHGESLTAHQQYLEELNIQKEEVEVYLAHRIPEMRLEQKLKIANCQAIANALSKDKR